MQGKESFLESDKVHGVVFKPLGCVQGHQRNLVFGLFVFIEISVKRNSSKVFGQSVAGAVGSGESRSSLDERLDILHAGLPDRLVFLKQFRNQIQVIHQLLSQKINRHLLKLPTVLLDQINERLEAFSHRRQLREVMGIRGDLKVRFVFSPGQLSDSADRLRADAALRVVDDALEGNIVVGVGDQFQVSNEVLDFLPLIEGDATHNLIGQAPSAQLFLERTGLGVGAVEHGHFAQRSLHPTLLDRVDDSDRFSLGVVDLPQLQLLADLAGRAEGLTFARLIVRDHGRGGLQNFLRRPVVLFQLNDPGAGIVFLEIQNVANIGAAPSIDGLVFITHDTDIVVVADDVPEHQILHVIGVLIFIDHDIPEAPPVALADRLVVF